MNYRILAGFLGVVMACSLPFAVGAQSVDELQAQLADLMGRIAELQQQLGTNATSTPATASQSSGVAGCPQVGFSLKLGSTGDDVTRLQRFLARDPSIYPEGTVSGYYGSLTEAAVRRWQAQNNIVSSGSPESTGYGVFGPRTAAAMSLMCVASGGGGVPGAPAGGFIQVSPATGQAPLAVAIQVTVNAANSCDGGTYTLDYGDGSLPTQIVVPPNKCFQVNQTIGHLYQYGGTYKVTLASGEHQASATVTLTGPARPPGGGDPTFARGSLSALNTVGTAPFKATFYVSCTSGIAYNVVFGDGEELTSDDVAQTKCTGDLQAVEHVYTKTGSYSAQLVIFRQQRDGIGAATVATASITVNPGQSSSNGSITAFVTSGPAPLTTTFYISCAAGVAYNVVFGDGTELGTADVARSQCTGGLQSIQHTYSKAGTYNAQLVVFSQASNGVINPVNASQITITATGGNDGTSTVGAMTLTPSTSGNFLQVRAVFDVGNCQQYTLTWGDGQQSSATPACTGANSTITLDHTYTVGGTYTLKLTRGSRVDTASIVISN